MADPALARVDVGVGRVAAASAAAFLPISYGLPVVARSLWTFAVFGGVLVLAALGRGRLLAPFPLMALLGFSVFPAALLAQASAIDLREHWQAAALLMLFWMVCPAVFARHAPRLGSAAVVGFVAGQTISAMVALLQVATAGPVLGAATVYGRARGLAGHPNILGVMAAVAILASVAVLTTKGRWRKAAALAAALNLGALLAGASLTALFSLFAGLLVFLVARRVNAASVLTMILGAFLLFGAVNTFGPAFGIATPTDRIAQTTGQTSRIATLDERGQTVTEAWEGIHKTRWSWISGVGLDDASGAVGNREIPTHNIVVRAWYQGGVLFLLTLATVLLVLLRSVFRAAVAAKAPATAGSIVTLIAFSFTSASFAQPYFWLVLIGCWVAVGLALLPDPPDVASPRLFDVEGRRSAPVRS